MAPICSADRNMAKSLLEIELGHARARARTDQILDCTFKHVIGYMSLGVGDTVINRRAERPGEVVYQAQLGWVTLAPNSSNWRAPKIGEGFCNVRTTDVAVLQQSRDLRVHKLGSSQSRLEISAWAIGFLAVKTDLGTKLNYME